MSNTSLIELLNAQIGHELQAHQQYLAIATWFKLQNLDGFAELFLAQAQEEKEHALKVVNYLCDLGQPVRFPALAENAAHFASAQDAVAKALAWEREVTAQWKTIALTAWQTQDPTTFTFSQWYLTEQIEEVAHMEKLLALVQSGDNLFVLQAALPKA